MENQEITFMNRVVIEKYKLLNILKQNKAKHDEILKDALAGYWTLATEKVNNKKKEFSQALKEVKSDFDHVISKLEERIKEREKFDDVLTIQIFFKYNKDLGLKYPEDHSSDYNRAIRLVELSAYDKVSLDETEFERYVMNNWEWKQSFITTNSAYYAVTGCAISGNENVLARQQLDKLKQF